MNPRLTSARRSGFSMIELILAVGILGVIFGLAGLVASASSGAFGEATTSSELDTQAKLTLDRIALELQVASTGTFDPELDAGVTNTSNLTFQQLVGIDDVTGEPRFGGPELDEVMTLTLLIGAGEVADGTDNDGDGLVDEWQLVLTRNVGSANEVATTLCGNVRSLLEGEVAGGGDENGNGLADEAGFDIERNGEVLTLRLSVEKRNSRGQVIVRTAETAIRLRN
jgi:prepilin-type N-terminal cleavage/methylation domain-containing protein